MLAKVHRYIRDQRLIVPGDRVIVAVSGGADSVALLRVLLDLRQDLGAVLAVAHFNHRIRGAEADADEQFVRDLAQQFELEFHSASGDVPAHSHDDQAETVLMRVLRGTGTRGLAGIAPWQKQKSLIRPLLNTTRREIEKYLNGLGQNWREDSSNRELHH